MNHIFETQGEDPIFGNCEIFKCVRCGLIKKTYIFDNDL